MKLQVHLSILLVTIISCFWADGANAPSCASMRSWFPGNSPSTLADNLPYQLSVSSYTRGGYYSRSLHTIYLNGSMGGDNKTRSFVGFIVYAENSVKEYPNGQFVKNNLSSGVEENSCGNLSIIQNSTTSGNWTSIKLVWEAPKDGYLAGNITFRAGVLEKTDPLTYYEGFTAYLKYACPVYKCASCPGGFYITDSYGCLTCRCNCEFVCAHVYAPVCGTDGKTYGNRCEMERHACKQIGQDVSSKKHLQVDYNGECGRCSKVCTEEHRPVCGTDGKTYSNKCTMESLACEKNKTITVSYSGECSGVEETVKFSILSLMFAFLAFLMFSDH